MQIQLFAKISGGGDARQAADAIDLGLQAMREILPEQVKLTAKIGLVCHHCERIIPVDSGDVCSTCAQIEEEVRQEMYVKERSLFQNLPLPVEPLEATLM